MAKSNKKKKNKLHKKSQHRQQPRESMSQNLDNNLEKNTELKTNKISAEELISEPKPSASDNSTSIDGFVLSDLRRTLLTTSFILFSFSILIWVMRQTEVGSKLINLIKL